MNHRPTAVAAAIPPILPAPEAESAVPALYLRQMAAYKALLSGIYPDLPVDCLLLWTDGPRLKQLSNALLDDHAP